jgi:Zn finger protein HypA/HybF involved in hydrogenase expression
MTTENTIECLKCDNRYIEKDNEFIKVCPHCGNDDVLETIYITPDGNMVENR